MNMFNSSLVETDDVIDKRIIREEYRNHDLVARYWEYGYLGKIWKNRKAVEEIDAENDESLDDLVVKMRAHVDAIIDAKSRARKNRAPGKTELIEAFHAIESRLTPLEKLLLKHCADSETGVAVETLQRLLNLSSPDSIFEILSRIGNKLNDELGYQPRGTKECPAAVRLLLTPGDRKQVQLSDTLQELVSSMNG